MVYFFIRVSVKNTFVNFPHRDTRITRYTITTHNQFLKLGLKVSRVKKEKKKERKKDGKQKIKTEKFPSV